MTLRVILVVAAGLIVIACGTSDKMEVKRYTIRQFMDIVQINGGSFSPDDTKVMINSKESGIFNAVAVDIQTGLQTPMTASTGNAIYGLSYFPGDERIIYTSDQGGNEINHLFVRNQDGSVIDLIQDSTAKAQFGGWSYSKKLLYYTSNSRDKNTLICTVSRFRLAKTRFIPPHFSTEMTRDSIPMSFPTTIATLL